MGLAEEIAALARLRDEGTLSDEEFARAKARLLDASAPAPDLRGLYEALTAPRRRLAAIALVLAVMSGLITLWFGVHAALLQRQVHAVEDRALFEQLGVRIPDPIPAVRRAELRLRASLRGVVAAFSGAIALTWLVVWLVARPTPPARVDTRGDEERGRAPPLERGP